MKIRQNWLGENGSANTTKTYTVHKGAPVHYPEDDSTPATAGPNSSGADDGAGTGDGGSGKPKRDPTRPFDETVMQVKTERKLSKCDKFEEGEKAAKGEE